MKPVLLFLAVCVCLSGMLLSGGCTEKQKCEDAGGSWYSSMLNGGECNLPAMDNGTVCTDGSQCEGRCILDEKVHWDDLTNVTGRCSAWRIVLGCYRYVENGTASGYFCYE